jgi:coatomer protein complex subunit alpha (xenin)
MENERFLFLTLESRAWEVDTCRGHFNNVSACVFVPRMQLIVSNSEDKTIRLWDINKRNALQTFRRENDRFWSLIVHPELNIFAAGHDSGMVVFKIERERPAFAVYGDLIYHVSDKYVKSYNMSNSTQNSLITINRGQIGSSYPHNSMSYNPAENSIILTSVFCF